MTEEKKSWKERQNIPDDAFIHLHDMSFDFEDYFDRYGTEKMDEEERKLFSARVMGLFCRDFFDSGGEPAAIQPWIANYLAKAMYEVLGGVPWKTVLRLPFDDCVYTEKGERGMEIYCDVEDGKRAGEAVTNMLAEKAKKFNISFETARGDYYKVKKIVEYGNDFPDGFLKKTP